MSLRLTKARRRDVGTVDASYQPFSTIPYLLRLDIANDKLRPFRFIWLYSNALFYRINRFKSYTSSKRCRFHNILKYIQQKMSRLTFQDKDDK